MAQFIISEIWKIRNDMYKYRVTSRPCVLLKWWWQQPDLFSAPRPTSCFYCESQALKEPLSWVLLLSPRFLLHARHLQEEYKRMQDCSINISNVALLGLWCDVLSMAIAISPEKGARRRSDTSELKIITAFLATTRSLCCSQFIVRF